MHKLVDARTSQPHRVTEQFGVGARRGLDMVALRAPDVRRLSHAEQVDLVRHDQAGPLPGDRTCRCERVPPSHSYAEASISVRDQQCRERYVAGRWYPTLGWARSPNPASVEAQTPDVGPE